MSPGDVDLECPETFPEEDEWKSPPRAHGSIPEDSRPEAKTIQSPEAITLVIDNNCRRCGFIRTEVVPYCQCGVSFWDKESDLEQSVEVPRKIQQLLVEAAKGEGPLFPLTIDPVSLRPTALPLNATWKDESNPE